MILDLKKLELQYAVNDKSMGIAYDNIEETVYRAFIMINGVGDSIDFISYIQSADSL